MGERDCGFSERHSGREIGDLVGRNVEERNCRFSGRDWGRELADLVGGSGGREIAVLVM